MRMSDKQLEKWKRERAASITVGLRDMSHEKLLAYFEEVAVQIVIAAGDIGDTDWPIGLHLGDVIEKHLMRRVECP